MLFVLLVVEEEVGGRRSRLLVSLSFFVVGALLFFSIWFNGRIIRLLFLSLISILRVLFNIFFIVSIYRRSRVIFGAVLYFGRSLVKRVILF